MVIPNNARDIEDLKVKVSKYMSYLLRHNPRDLKMDSQGYVDLEDLLRKVRERFPVDRQLLFEIVEKSEKKRFEVKNGKIRALYGHSIPVDLKLKEEKTVEVLYHGTTPEAAEKIMRTGLKPMKRRWVHLSPTIDIAIGVALRRTRRPVVIEVDVKRARKEGKIKFYKATEQVYLCSEIPPEYLRRII